jgi:hypothetical protein
MTAARLKCPAPPGPFIPNVALTSWQESHHAQPPGSRVITIRTGLAGLDDNAPEGQLLGRRYAWRGYRSVTLPADQTGHRTTLTAHGGDSAIGTLTLELDGPAGLSADSAFPDLTAALRQQGRRLVEFTRLAVDADGSSQRVLAALFHVGFIVAHQLRGYDTLLLEVNPRHQRFYERMLGCQALAPSREHSGVGAPAVLLTADFSSIQRQILALAGQRTDMCTDKRSRSDNGLARSLYPFAFSEDEEAGILGRLLQAQQPPSLLAS